MSLCMFSSMLLPSDWPSISELRLAGVSLVHKFQHFLYIGEKAYPLVSRVLKIFMSAA